MLVIKSRIEQITRLHSISTMLKSLTPYRIFNLRLLR